MGTAKPVAGRFITFEGGEGSGKSTQARRLAERLRGAGLDVLLTREPGGSPFAEQIRGLLLGGTLSPHPPIAEALLFFAARADHLEATIRPALAAGRWVICDRFSDSTRAYQGAAGGVPDAALDTLEALVVGASAPDVTFLLDVDAATGLARATRRREAVEGTEIDPFESRALAFHERLRQGYLAIAQRAPARCVSLDGSEPVAAIADRIWATIRQRFSLDVG